MSSRTLSDSRRGSRRRGANFAPVLSPSSLPATKQTGLDRDSVAHVSQLVTIDKRQLIERAGKVPRKHMEGIFSGIDLIMGR